MFFELIRAIATVLAALAALLGVYFGVTRAARLRRREQLFRESLTALPETDPRRRMVSELHRDALSHLIARQMTGTWRTVWPWFAWLIIAVLSGQIGYLGSAYMARDTPFSFFDFFLETTGDGFTTPILMLGGFLSIFPQIYRSQVWTLLERARLARRFYDGKSIETPAVLLEIEIAAEMKARRPMASDQEATNASASVRTPGDPPREIWLSYGRSLTPALFCTFAGLLVGMYVWIARQSGDRIQVLNSLGWFVFVTILGFVLTALPTATTWHGVVRELRKLAPGGKHPESSGRVRTNLSSQSSRQTVAPSPRRVPGPVRRQAARAARQSRRDVQQRREPRRLGRPARLKWRRPGRR